MLKTLFPYIKLYKHYFSSIILGLTLVLLGLSASIFLLSLSGWFLSATAFVGVSGLYTFNYMLPAAGVRFAAITRTASRYFDRLANHNTTFKILSYLRDKTFRKILPLSTKQLSHFEKADLLNRFIADIEHLDHLYLRLFMPIVSGVVTSILLYFAMRYFNEEIALIIAIILFLSILIIPIIFYNVGKNLGANIALEQQKYRAKLVSYLQGQAELTMFNAIDEFREELDKSEQKIFLYQKRQTTLLSFANALITLIIGLMTVLVIYHISFGIPHFSNPMMALFVFVSLAMTEVLLPIPAAFLYLGQILMSAKRMNHLIVIKPDVTFSHKKIDANYSKADVSFKDITFSYPKQSVSVFKQFSYEINQGEYVALIGKTGTGKSTLLNLLTKTWNFSTGEILINDINIDRYDEISFRKMMSVVPQVIVIFNDTLRNNLLIGQPNATDEALINVLKSVELQALLNTNEGLDLVLGEKGRRLSGGEKRRIGIARALLHDAPLILLDEPTESLDSKTEAQIIHLIKNTFKDKTIIMATHRLINHQMFDKTIDLTKAN